MTSLATIRAPLERLRASPSFALAFALDGRPYVAKETEPYTQYWLSERYRVLLSLFSGRHGATIGDAVEGYLRVTGGEPTRAERKRLLDAIDDMRAAGVLITGADDVSRYDSAIVDAYLTHRPFPRELTEVILREAQVARATRILDLAGGPGDLALQLARASDEVALMELSRGFVTSARGQAKKLGLPLTTIHDSANRLMFRDDSFDVVTVSQALHWLDDVLVCRGLCRVLRAGGSFFVVHGAFDVADEHPLAYLFGPDSILGKKARRSFAVEVEALLRRLTLLFDALDAPDVERIDLSQPFEARTAPRPRIVPVGASLFRQRRPMGEGFARAFLTPQHIAATGQSPVAFWQDLEERCADASTEALLGTYHWGVLHFRRGGEPLAPLAVDADRVTEIDFEPGSPSRRDAAPKTARRRPARAA